MRILIASLLLLCTSVAAAAQGQTDEPPSGLSWSEWVLLVMALLAAVALYDRRQHYRYLTHLRTLLGEAVIRWRNFKNRKTEINEKLSTEDSLQTTKRNLEVYDSEKTYIEADLSSIMQETLPGSGGQSEQAMALELEAEAPKVSLKEVFEKKESKSKHKANKKPKSKIRNRVMNKASEESENERDEETVEENSLTEENSFNGDNSLDLDPAPPQ